MGARGENVRDYLVFEARKKENRDFGYGGNYRFGGPDLVAEKREVARWWDDPVAVSHYRAKRSHRRRMKVVPLTMG